MRKILIFGDIHGRTFWRYALDHHEEYDKIIFLGDYLDHYKGEVENEITAIHNFIEIIEFKKQHPDKVILLVGNHDESYRSYTFYRLANGGRHYDLHHEDVCQLFHDNKDLFSLAHEETVGEKNYLFTHAGLTLGWYEENKEVIGDLTVENLNKLDKTHQGELTLTQISFYRYGGYANGSILWADIREHDKAKEKLSTHYQIFAHTYLKKEYITEQWACLDCQKPMVLEETEDGNRIVEAKNN